MDLSRKVEERENSSNSSGSLSTNSKIKIRKRKETNLRVGSISLDNWGKSNPDSDHYPLFYHQI